MSRMNRIAEDRIPDVVRSIPPGSLGARARQAQPLASPPAPGRASNPGRCASIVIACSDASDLEKRGADIVLDATDDDVQINAALQSVLGPDPIDNPLYGDVRLLGSTAYCSGTIILPASCALTGGVDGAGLVMADGVDGIHAYTGSVIQGLYVGVGATAATGIDAKETFVWIQDSAVNPGANAASIGVHARHETFILRSGLYSNHAGVKALVTENSLYINMTRIIDCLIEGPVDLGGAAMMRDCSMYGPGSVLTLVGDNNHVTGCVLAMTDIIVEGAGNRIDGNTFNFGNNNMPVHFNTGSDHSVMRHNHNPTAGVVDVYIAGGVTGVTVLDNLSNFTIHDSGTSTKLYWSGTNWNA